MNLNSPDLEKKISSLLANPEAMASVFNMVKTLVPQSDSDNSQFEEKKQELLNTDPIRSLQSGLSTEAVGKQSELSKDAISTKSIGLLLALKPFLSANKCEKIDAITKLLKIATLTELFK